MKTITKTFYTEAEYAYLQIVNNETSGMDITKLDSESFSPQNDSLKLKKLYEQYLDMYPIPCDELPINNFTQAYVNSNTSCAGSIRKVNAAFYLNRNCNISNLQIKNYLEEDNIETKSVQNACGYIAYATRDSQGIIGEDFFIIGLGKRSVKY